MAENIVVNTTNSNVVINQANPENPLINTTVFSFSSGLANNINIFQSGTTNNTNLLTNITVSEKNTRTIAVLDPLSYQQQNVFVSQRPVISLLGITTGGSSITEKTIFVGSSGLQSIISCNNGRLTLESNNPTPTGNITNTTIYYTPYLGNNIGLYDTNEQKWKLYEFNQISLSLSGISANTNYDIFIYNTSSLNLESQAWTNNTTRSTPLVYKDGILVKDTQNNKRYVGTIRSTTAGNVEDSSSRRFVFNLNNQIPKKVTATDSTTHTYTSSNIRNYRNISTVGLTKIEFITGLNNTIIDTICGSVFATETGSSSVGIGLDTSSTFNTNAKNTTMVSSGPALIFDNNAVDYVVIPSAGYHYLQMLQSGGNVSTFYNAQINGLFLC